MNNLFVFLLGPEPIVERKNSTKTHNKITADDTPLDMNSTAVHNYHYDPNASSTKSAACIIL
jgi:hypothetical protein